MAALSEFVDGEASPSTRAHIEAHVTECDWCRQFGSDFSRLLATMRQQMAVPPPTPDSVLERLQEALKAP